MQMGMPTPSYAAPAARRSAAAWRGDETSASVGPGGGAYCGQAAAPSRTVARNGATSGHTEDLPESALREIDECIVVDLQNLSSQ